MSSPSFNEHCERFVAWLHSEVVRTARGDSDLESEHRPSGRFWLGRLASEEAIANRGLGERGERLEPCAIGFRAMLARGTDISFTISVDCCAWDKPKRGSKWKKTRLPTIEIPVQAKAVEGSYAFGRSIATNAYRDVLGHDAIALEAQVSIRPSADDNQVLATVLVVNKSPEESQHIEDTTLYEVRFKATQLVAIPFELEALPDSFRYDRRVGYYGINCGLTIESGGAIVSLDAATVDRARPVYWTATGEPPDFSFSTVASDPIGVSTQLANALEEWGKCEWSTESIKKRAAESHWSSSMVAEATTAAAEFHVELNRVRQGVALLRHDERLQKAFCLMNQAMSKLSERKNYREWRPFQLGFLLANLQSLVEGNGDNDVVDVVWFATGGGKTETYLGLIAIAAFYDRLRGKSTGITAWSRFPLRMLSLQQTQRFADAMAMAELVRQEAGIQGDPFSVGFFVGRDATPNSIKPESRDGGPDVEDPDMPAQYQVLLRCPFCRHEPVEMAFNRVQWRLEHRCSGPNCSWKQGALPFVIVDDEIFRLLPTVLVGTLDKAASISMQASMRGLVGAPHGRCSIDGHGFTYAPRAARRNGCLVPDCRGTVRPVGMQESYFGPSLRLQDELHLLKDSLGAVDAHYEALYDGLQKEICGRRPKILASSATLTGYQKQIDVLYRRQARVFPVPPPSKGSGFWTSDSNDLMRRYVALAPRGVTLEFMTDNLINTLQKSVRRLATDAENVAKETGIPADQFAMLLSLYGTNVVYGNTLRDLDAVDRSLQTQIHVDDGRLNTDSLTGRREFKDVRGILDKLEKPEEDFGARLHVITASSMMSHGVDIDRLNVMCMLGLPLTTAEFIQASARTGRTYPGLVFVAFKMARERDAGIYRLFDKYIEQGDRFVEPVPVTRRSRRVLERTVAGLELARILMVHEPASSRSLVSISELRRYLAECNATADTELESLCAYLGLDGPLDEAMKRDLHSWLESFFRNIDTPPPGSQFASHLSITGGPMLSLRDVEEQTQIIGSLS